MGQSFFEPAVNTSSAVHQSQLSAARGNSQPAFAARGAQIAAQKFVSAAEKAGSKPGKKSERSAAYPKGPLT